MEAWALARTPQRAGPGRDIAVCLQMDMTGARMLRQYLDGVKGKNETPKARQKLGAPHGTRPSGCRYGG